MAATLLTMSCAGNNYDRTELYLGLSTPGAAVTDREFQQFLDEVVTPRFPDGYTVYSAEGRWRDAKAKTPRREGTRVLVILRAHNDTTDGKIEIIRREYKMRFDQESVLRVDQPAKASF